MKRVRMIIFLFLLPAFIFAQDETLKDIYKDVTTAVNSALLTRAGALEISGFASYNYYNTEYSDNESITQNIFLIEPLVAYFVADNLALGVDLSYLYDYTIFSSREISYTQTYVGPLIKFYFGDKRFRPFVTADYLFLIGNSYDGGEFDLGGGVLYHLAGNIGINLFAKYGIIRTGRDDINTKNRVFIGIGVSGFII